MTNLIVGILAAIFTYVITKLLERVLVGPRLLISYSPKYSASPPDSDSSDPIHEFCCIQMNIQNTSIFVAKGCKIFMTRLEEVLPDGTIKELLHEAKQLPWTSTSEGVSIDLPKGIVFYFQLLRSDSGKSPFDQFQPQNVMAVKHAKILGIAGKHFHLDRRIEVNTDYNLTIVATAENSEPYEYNCVARVNSSDKGFSSSFRTVSAGYQSPILNLLESFRHELQKFRDDT
jgi:hypothetical protein